MDGAGFDLHSVALLYGADFSHAGESHHYAVLNSAKTVLTRAERHVVVLSNNLWFGMLYHIWSVDLQQSPGVRVANNCCSLTKTNGENVAFTRPSRPHLRWPIEPKTDVAPLVEPPEKDLNTKLVSQLLSNFLFIRNSQTTLAIY